MLIGCIGCDHGITIAVDALARLPYVKQIIVLDPRNVTDRDVVEGTFSRRSVGARRDKVVQTEMTVRMGAIRVTCVDAGRGHDSRMRRILATADLIIVSPSPDPVTLPVIESLRMMGRPIVSTQITRSGVRIIRGRDRVETNVPKEQDAIDPIAALGVAIGVIEAVQRWHAQITVPDVMTVPLPEPAPSTRPLATLVAGERIVICGVGALGSHIADRLIRLAPESLTIVDHDIVEERNRVNQVYGVDAIGKRKVDALVTRWRAEGFLSPIVPLGVMMDDRSATDLVPHATLVIDCFDNRRSRAVITDACAAHAVPCLHMGMAAGFCDVAWNDTYHVPDDAPQLDPCRAPLAHSLVLFTTLLGYAALTHHSAAGLWQDMWGTMGDITIHVSPRRSVCYDRVLPSRTVIRCGS